MQTALQQPRTAHIRNRARQTQPTATQLEQTLARVPLPADGAAYMRRNAVGHLDIRRAVHLVAGVGLPLGPGNAQHIALKYKGRRIDLRPGFAPQHHAQPKHGRTQQSPPRWRMVFPPPQHRTRRFKNLPYPLQQANRLPSHTSLLESKFPRQTNDTGTSRMSKKCPCRGKYRQKMKLFEI